MKSSANGIVITGAASGIGLATARLYAARGWRVLMADIDAAAIVAARRTILDRGSRDDDVRAMPCDVASRDDALRLADAAFGWGSVDVVFCNAGVGVSGPLMDMTDHDWDWVMGVNFGAALHAIRAFIPRMRAQDHPGQIAFNTSFSGLMPQPGLGVYCVSKAAVITLAEILRKELWESRIGVSVVCPMRVSTEIGSSGRNRPPAENAPSLAGEVTDPHDARGVGRLISAEEAAFRIAEGLDRNDFYILTHSEGREYIEHRFGKILAAFNAHAVEAVAP